MKSRIVTALLVAAALILPSTPAQAATPDRWGFAYVDVPLAPNWTDLNHAYQWGSWKTASAAWAQGRVAGGGLYQVKFPLIGSGSRGIAHVTAVGATSNGTNQYCHLFRWYQMGVDQIVEVKCQAPQSTAPTATRFTVLWTLSSGVLPAGSPAHAYIHRAPGELYNSTPGGTVTINGTNPYLVQFFGVGLAAATSGDVQVTAVASPGLALRCKVLSLGGTTNIAAYVACYNHLGVLAPNTSVDFVASYHRERAVFGAVSPPRAFGYLRCVNGAAAGGPTNYNNMTGLASNTCNPNGGIVDRYVASYPHLFMFETTFQVTAQGGQIAPGSDASTYCNIAKIWLPGDPVTPWVDCYDNAGQRAKNNFLATFSSSRVI